MRLKKVISKAFYDDPVFDYRKYWRGRAYEQAVEFKILERVLPKGKNSVLDVGSGFGRFYSLYKSRFEKIILLDPSEKILSQGREEVGGDKRVSFVQGEAQNLKFRKESFDVLVCFRVLHHLGDEEVKKALKEFYRVLKRGGILVLEYANKIHLRARLRDLIIRKRDWWVDENTLDRRTFKNVISDSIAFNNFHPRRIKRYYEKVGFVKEQEISCSYFRLNFFKFFVFRFLLVRMDLILQRLFSHKAWGPSNVLVLRKK